MLAQLVGSVRDLKGFAYQVGFVLTVMGSVWNFGYLLLRRDRVEALLESVRALPWGTPFCDDMQDARPGHTVDRLTVWMIVSYCSATAFWASLSVMADPPALIFGALYPFEWRRPRWRHLALLATHCAAGAAFDVLAGVFNGLYLKLATLLGAQLRHLATSLRGAASARRLVACAKHHRAILGVMNELKSVLSPLLLGHFVIAQLGICCVIFSAISCWQASELQAELSKMIIIWLFLVTQLFWLCWFGHYLTDEADKISSAVYDSGWEESPNMFRRVVCMIVIQANHPFFLTAGSFVPVSLTTMTNILQQSVSYLMVMVSLTDTDTIGNFTQH